MVDAEVESDDGGERCLQSAEENEDDADHVLHEGGDRERRDHRQDLVELLLQLRDHARELGGIRGRPERVGDGLGELHDHDQ